MKIIIQDENYEFSCDFGNEHPNVEEAVFAACYLLGRIYPKSKVKECIMNVSEDI